MTTMYKLLTTVLIFCVIGGLSFIYGYKIANRQDEINITSTTILERISEKYFIVTKTLLLDESTEIEVDKGSDWSNLLWGQKINAEAKVSINVGVDLSDLDEQDIKIEPLTKKITVSIPHATILSSSIEGDFDIETTDGILKKIFKDTTNNDYNQAIKGMKQQAEMKVKANTELLSEAEENALKLLDMILDNLGYKLEFVFKEAS
jgi:hypothetical protein